MDPVGEVQVDVVETDQVDVVPLRVSLVLEVGDVSAVSVTLHLPSLRGQGWWGFPERREGSVVARSGVCTSTVSGPTAAPHPSTSPCHTPWSCSVCTYTPSKPLPSPTTPDPRRGRPHPPAHPCHSPCGRVAPHDPESQGRRSLGRTWTRPVGLRGKDHEGVVRQTPSGFVGARNSSCPTPCPSLPF